MTLYVIFKIVICIQTRELTPIICLVSVLILLNNLSFSWESLVSSSKWLHYISCLLKSAVTISEAIEDDRSCLVHCSDGWDRTPQLVSLVQLMLDPYYRTYDGFRVLVEKEWIEFGHKFADRHGVMPEDDNSYEKCPIFQQWLDCVYQIVLQHSEAFEFNVVYLVSLLFYLQAYSLISILFSLSL